MRKCISIEGSHITDIASFYEEINRVLMPNENWKLAQSLDALDDLLYGGYGEIKGNEPVQLVWHHIEQSKAALGLSATRAFYQEKLAQPSVYNLRINQERLDALEKGTGQTYFEIVMEIIAGHPNIELI